MVSQVFNWSLIPTVRPRLHEEVKWKIKKNRMFTDAFFSLYTGVIFFEYQCYFFEQLFSFVDTRHRQVKHNSLHTNSVYMENPTAACISLKYRPQWDSLHLFYVNTIRHFYGNRSELGEVKSSCKRRLTVPIWRIFY